ncbi:hypothetical protein N7541_011408 [Penicillium brevicompactum]|uniref:Enoyl reductase (ER) domain-containing protein n=1 Tax=Penicillium brevicompactum TaxID=5074 RepID=A0A9W9QTE4_PENBR|nr:hypothetical protein N7541_011408 [Penicillium brevicompactum]
MSKSYRTIILKNFVPSGQTVSPHHFETQIRPIPKIAEGEALLRPLAFSVDPGQRPLISGATDTMIPPYTVGRPIRGPSVARVIETRTPDLMIGSLVQGWFDWADYVVTRPSKDGMGPTPLDPQIEKPSYALSVYGITGVTAYFGMTEVAQVQPGETVVVSSAAGSTGSIASQIAKIRGAKVIGLTSTQAKQEVLTRQLGLDFALDYRAEDFADQLRSIAPNGPDLYFDAVGGQLSQTIMQQMRRPARVVEVGQIATYDDEKAWTVDITHIHMNGLRFEGYQPNLWIDQWPKAVKELQEWVKSGAIQPLETEITGLESLPQALQALFEGQNTGKMVVLAKDDEQ